MAKAKPHPFADIPLGTEQIYYDQEHAIWKCRRLCQNEPDNPRSPQRWRDVDLHNDQAVLTARHAKATIIR